MRSASMVTKCELNCRVGLACRRKVDYCIQMNRCKHHEWNGK